MCIPHNCISYNLYRLVASIKSIFKKKEGLKWFFIMRPLLMSCFLIVIME